MFENFLTLRGLLAELSRTPPSCTCSCSHSHSSPPAFSQLPPPLAPSAGDCPCPPPPLTLFRRWATTWAASKSRTSSSSFWLVFSSRSFWTDSRSWRGMAWRAGVTVGPDRTRGSEGREHRKEGRKEGGYSYVRLCLIPSRNMGRKFTAASDESRLAHKNLAHVVRHDGMWWDVGENMQREAKQNKGRVCVSN